MSFTAQIKEELILHYTKKRPARKAELAALVLLDEKNVSRDPEKGVFIYTFTSLKKTFKPEFLNRIDEIIIFNKLGYEQIYSIAEKQLGEFLEKIKNDFGYEIEADEKVINLISEKAISEKSGARPVRSVITNLIENKISDLILLEKLKKNQKYMIFCENNTIEILDTNAILL